MRKLNRKSLTTALVVLVGGGLVGTQTETGKQFISVVLQSGKPAAPKLPPVNMNPVVRDWDGGISDKDPKYAQRVRAREQQEWEARQDAWAGIAAKNRQPASKPSQQAYIKILREVFTRHSPLTVDIFRQDQASLNDKNKAFLQSAIEPVAREFIKNGDGSALAFFSEYFKYPSEALLPQAVGNQDNLKKLVASLEKATEEFAGNKAVVAKAKTLLEMATDLSKPKRASQYPGDKIQTASEPDQPQNTQQLWHQRVLGLFR